MIERIKAFLSAGRERRDQAISEATIELLLLAMYADGELSTAERLFLDEYGTALPWHSETSKERFIGSAFTRVREVHAKGQRKAFILAMADRLPKADDRLHLFTACHKLFKADGEMPATEKAFLADVKAGFAIA